MSWTHMEEKTVRARKAHRCTLCGHTITPKEDYVRRVGVDTDGFITMRMHLCCEKATRDWDDMDWECAVDEHTFFWRHLSSVAQNDILLSERQARFSDTTKGALE